MAAVESAPVVRGSSPSSFSAALPAAFDEWLVDLAARERRAIGDQLEVILTPILDEIESSDDPNNVLDMGLNVARGTRTKIPRRFLISPKLLKRIDRFATAFDSRSEAVVVLLREARSRVGR